MADEERVEGEEVNGGLEGEWLEEEGSWEERMW